MNDHALETMKMFKLFGDKMTEFYNTYWLGIQANQYSLSSIEDALIFRLCALRKVGHHDGAVRSIASKFLKATSRYPEDATDDDLRWLDCDPPQIISKKTSHDLNAIVYRVKSRLNGTEAHEIAFFKLDKDGCYVFERKLDLMANHQKYCFNLPTNDNIRQIGDPVLHQEAKDVSCFDGDEGDALKAQLEILKKNLYQTGGVGIAANQCSEISIPYKIILSGVDYENEEHVTKALTRYPTALFPRMKVMVNPVILSLDDECSEFSEGCLSVCGSIRGQVRRPRSVVVQYQDMGGETHIETYEGTDARVMLHELDHILNGFVYIERIIAELALEQCRQLLDVLKTVLLSRRDQYLTSFFSQPKQVFNRNHLGEIVFDESELSPAFAEMPEETLIGVIGKLEERLNLSQFRFNNPD